MIRRHQPNSGCQRNMTASPMEATPEAGSSFPWGVAVLALVCCALFAVRVRSAAAGAFRWFRAHAGRLKTSRGTCPVCTEETLLAQLPQCGQACASVCKSCWAHHLAARFSDGAPLACVNREPGPGAHAVGALGAMSLTAAGYLPLLWWVCLVVDTVTSAPWRRWLAGALSPASLRSFVESAKAPVEHFVAAVILLAALVQQRTLLTPTMIRGATRLLIMSACVPAPIPTLWWLHVAWLPLTFFLHACTVVDFIVPLYTPAFFMKYALLCLGLKAAETAPRRHELLRVVWDAVDHFVEFAITGSFLLVAGGRQAADIIRRMSADTQLALWTAASVVSVIDMVFVGVQFAALRLCWFNFRLALLLCLAAAHVIRNSEVVQATLPYLTGERVIAAESAVRNDASARRRARADPDRVRAWRQYEQDERQKEQLYRLCPNCQRLTERIEGCDMMVCGRDYHAIPDAGAGCGTGFRWSEAAPYRADLESHPLYRLMAGN
jgi:hypothetical protein